MDLGWLTDRAMHRTPQNRRCTARLYSSRISTESAKKASKIRGR